MNERQICAQRVNAFKAPKVLTLLSKFCHKLVTDFKTMSATRSQSTITFSVRKSSRSTNKVNYSETKGHANGSPVSKTKDKTKAVDTLSKSRVRKCLAKSEPEFGENEDKTLCPSPTKVKKTSENKETSSPIAKTKHMLTSSVVDSVIGRDQECEKVSNLVTSHLEARKAVSLYISGSAGTGKTLSVTHVMSRLKESFDFHLITINCMSFRNSNSIFNKILTEMNQKKCPKSGDSMQAVADLLTDSGKMIVLILDEIDQLDTKTHDVLTNIFLWTKSAKSRLILVGIANALDFTTRVLSRIKSIHSANIHEMHFLPYNTQQIVAIIEDRIKRVSDERNVIITPAAVQLCARKIGSCSGDIRKALDVCRRAIDLAEASVAANGTSQPLKPSNDDGFNVGSPKKVDARHKCVDVPQIMSVLNQVYDQQMDSMSKKFLPFNQQIILCALLVCCKHKSLKEVKLDDCLRVFVKICAKRGISYNAKSESDFLSMCELLSDYGFVAIKRVNKNIRNSKLSLRVNDSEIEHSLSDTLYLNSILRQSSAYF